MALTITRNDKIFKVEGPINSSTASFFKTHFAITLNSLSGLSIDINKVTEIDDKGLLAIKSLFENSITWNKPFSIIGEGSNLVYDALNYSSVA